MATLANLLMRRASDAAHAIAYGDGDAQLTFAQLAERASARAAELGRAGVGTGDRIAVVLPAGLEFLELWWALQLAGAAPCAFAPDTPDATLRRRVARLRPRAVVTSDGVELLGREPRSDEDLAFLQATSGTSGEPRLVIATHAQIVSHVQALAGDGHLRADDVIVCWAPPWHDLGLVMLLIPSVVLGIPCHVVPPAVRTIPDWLRTISEVRGTVTGAPDFTYRLAERLVPPETVDLSSLRSAIIGAEPVRATTVERFRETFRVGDVFTPGYGLAEAMCAVTFPPRGTPVKVDARGNVACGSPIGGLVLEAGSSADEPDEIRIRAPWTFSGYLEAPAETQRVLRDGWLHTGDTGYVDGEGQLYVLGRRSGMIKRGGAVVAPRELEEAAETVAGVRRAAAVDLGAAGERIVVVVEAFAAQQEVKTRIGDDVARAVASAVGFAPHAVHVARRNWIPRTTNWKLRHAQLREMLAAENVT